MVDFAVLPSTRQRSYSCTAVRLAHQAAGVLERGLLSLLDAAVFVHFVIVIPALHSRPSERNQILDRYGTDSDLKQFDPHDPKGVPGVILGGQKFKSPEMSSTAQKINNFFFKPTPPQVVQVGILGGQVREMSWTAQKMNNLFLTPIPPCGWEF